MVAPTGKHRSGEHSDIPARVLANVEQIEIQARRKELTDEVWRRLHGDRRPDRQPQVEADTAIIGSPEMDVERWPNFDRRLKVRHAPARGRVAATYWGRRIDAEVDLDAILIEQQATNAIAVGAQVLAAIDEIRHRQRVHVTGVGAAVVGEAERPDP